jgi:pimeloyl-ACP methyl ester carboxylesterase
MNAMRESEPFHLHILGSDVRYWVYNDEKPHTIVMVHGFRGTHHGLHDIIRALPDFKIIVPDLPGFGDSTPMTDERHDITGYTKFVAAFVHEMHFTAKPTLLGHSFGSIVAASIAAQSPELFDKLILVNAIASPPLKGPRKVMSYGAKLYYRAGAKLPEKAGRKLLSSKVMVQATSVFLAKTKDKALRRDIHRHHHRHFSSFQTREALLEAFDASVDNTATDYAANIHLPTLLVAGAVDDIAPLKGQLEIEQLLPDARLVVIQDVGHLIHREAPKEAAEAIAQFLS